MLQEYLQSLGYDFGGVCGALSNDENDKSNPSSNSKIITLSLSPSPSTPTSIPRSSILVTLALFSELDSMSQMIIKRLLHLSDPFPFELMRKEWHLGSIAPSEWRPAQNASLLLLKKLNILQGMHGEVFLNQSFKKQLLEGLDDFYGGNDSNQSVEWKIPPKNDKSLPSWDLHLYSLIKGGTDKRTIKSSQSPPTIVRKIFKSLSFIDEEETITNDGFAFLLKKKSEQLFMVIFKFLDSLTDQTKKLGGIYIISSLILGITPPPSLSSQTNDQFISFLKEINIIDRHLLPTHLSLYLRPRYKEEVRMESSLIMETNHKLYFYTNDPLQIAIISSFTQITSSFPNMIGGQLTGSSVAVAFKKGITANQLIEYLKSLTEASSSIPMVIEDQIRVWEGMQRRLNGRNRSILYKNFANTLQFNAVKEETIKRGSLLYSNPLKKVLVVKREFENSTRLFIQSLK